MTKISLWTAFTGLSASAAAFSFSGGFANSHHLHKRTGSILFDHIPASYNITWQPCHPIASTLQCAKLLVPLDHTDPSNPAHLSLALMKQPALVPEDSPSWAGPLLYNPGGPGAEAIQRMIFGEGEKMQAIVGGNFSIIAFDPRGVGSSQPEANCLESPTAWYRNWRKNHLNARSLLTGGWEAAAELYASQVAYNRVCARKYGDEAVWKYVGTAAVARDMVKISDLTWAAAGKEAKGVMYWGQSYGTVLGQYFATLLPEKVGRFVLDGVVDTDSWQLTESIPETWVGDTDKAIDSFSTYCAMSAACSMNPSRSESAASIRRRVNKIIEYVKKTPIVPTSTLNPINFQQFAAAIYSTLYDPIFQFQFLSNFFQLLESTVVSGLPLDDDPSTYMFSPGLAGPEQFCEFNEDYEFGPWGNGNSDLYRWVKCGDRTNFDKFTPESLLNYMERLARVSQVGSIQMSNAAVCAGMEDRSVYQAVETVPKSGSKTAHPILFIGTTADPVTPIRNAFTASQKFPGSIALVQDSTGHCSISAPSACTASIIATYFSTGTLPKAGTVCKVDEVPFQDVAAQEALLQEVLGEQEARKVQGYATAKGRKGGVSVEQAARELTESWRRNRARRLYGKGGVGVGVGLGF